jgi:monoamine oxidase
VGVACSFGASLNAVGLAHTALTDQRPTPSLSCCRLTHPPTHTHTQLLTQLRTWYTTSLPTPSATYVTRWWTDPWSFGSYSYQAPGCTGNERAAFSTAEPSGAGTTPRVWFAGEHVSVDYPSTMQGAFLTGKAAAAAVALKHTATP